MKPGYKVFFNESARLTILKELAIYPGFISNEVILTNTLDTYGYRGSREWVRTQILKLEEIDAVSVQEKGSVLVVTLLAAGMDHISGRSKLEGVSAPRPGV